MIMSSKDAVGLWRDLLKEDVKPCGLGARDTLRLEVGYNLYGSDMDHKTSPLVSHLSWTVSFKDADRDFVGRKALEKEKAEGVAQKLVGLVMTDPGVLRDHQKVFIDGVDVGEITSGGFSPTLKHAIALARVPIDAKETAEVERRGKRVPVKLVKLPFIIK
jgi:aminomethyltransferase